MIRVLVADDEPMVRTGVRTILTTDPGIEVVAEAGDGREAVDLVREHRPDVAVLDIRMPVLDGLAAAREILRLAPGTAIVMLTTFGEDAYIAQALGDGASGFLLKAGDPRELLGAVRAVADGAAFLSPKVARRLIAEFGKQRMARGQRAQDQVAALSGREREVLGYVGAGLSNGEIAARLHVVEGTVKAYMTAILQRLDVKNRVQAAIIAHEAGLSPHQPSTHP